MLIDEFFSDGEDGAPGSGKKIVKKKPHDEDDEERRFWAKKTVVNYKRMAEQLKEYFVADTPLHKMERLSPYIFG